MSNEMKNNFGPVDAESKKNLQALLDAMNQNNAESRFTSYSGFEVTETRRKYHLLNHVLTNGQRSGLFLIDVKTHVVYKSVAYGKTNGRTIGTVASLLRDYTEANRVNALTRGN
jgi:hypothetical protein